MQNLQDSPLSRLSTEVTTKESSDGEILKKSRIPSSSQESGGSQQADLNNRIVHRVLQQDNNNSDNTRDNNSVNSVSSGTSASSSTTIVDDENTRQLFHAALVADKYLLLDQVEGSSLYRCLNVHTQQELVCKVVTRDCNNLLNAHYRLEGDARVSALHEVLIGDRDLYLVFPRAHGDLHSYVRQRRRLREPEARRLFRQVAEAVKSCHEQGIVLRDLKLRKFVFSDPQRTELKLESLEDAVVLEDADDDWLHDKRGCPAYVSPEILRAGHRYSGKAADMWSLGVILYTMLVGRYPFNDSEHASLFAKISRGHFLIPDCLSSRSRCLIRSLLRREPSERLTSEDILHHPWLASEDRECQGRQCGDQLVPQWNPPQEDDE